MSLWIKRKFWDGTEAIFIQHRGSMSCFSLDSDELNDVIIERKNELNSEMDEWRDLQDLREEYMNRKRGVTHDSV